MRGRLSQFLPDMSDSKRKERLDRWRSALGAA
jgi:hypothetical protein